jgi:hypothetical protein
MRANPWLLDYVFASLPQDKLTADEYGLNEVERAKEWFQQTDISVVYTITTNDPKFPCISISLLASAEVEQEGTLSDTHYEPFEDNNWDWPTLAGPLTPLAYTAATGTMAVDPTGLKVVLAPGMIVMTRAGVQYPILDVLDRGTFKIKAGAVDNFNGMIVKSANPAFITELESAVFRETYAIGAHVDSEPVHLTYLHSILTFALKRYNEALLEGRGFERMTINSSDLKRDDEVLPEFLFSRYLQLSGSVRQSWPKTVTMKGTGVIVTAQESQVNGPPVTPPNLDDFEALLDADPLSFIGS